MGFTSPRPPPPPKASKTAPMDLSVGKGGILAKEGAKRFADGS